LASTYGYAPRVFARLHDLARNPGSAHWAAAIDRLADVGNGFTLEHLRAMDTRALDAGPRDALAALLEVLVKRAVLSEREVALQLGPLLECAAYADLVCAPIEVELCRWTLASIAAHAGHAEVRAALEQLEVAYQPGEGTSEQLVGSMQARVRFYARELLR
jgi:hypothetical protein